jgi:hypothetical protein
MIASRLGLAETLSRGRRVLDIGGRKMAGNDEKYPKFARAYQKVHDAAKEHRIVDVQNDPQVDYVIDLNRREGVDTLAGAIADYRPEVILCMETLEHLNYHYETMNVIAGAVRDLDAVTLITLPNNSNWIVNHLIGITDHNTAFFKDVAWRFITRSGLGQFEVVPFPCTGTYLWYWRIAYAAAGFQSTSLGFLIGRPENAVFREARAALR